MPSFLHRPAPPETDAEPFWRAKPLAAMSPAEWESLCDGCGRCCLVKLEDEDTGKIHYTDVGCTLLDPSSCGCRDYADRQSHVPDCVRLTPSVVEDLPWLPRSCAYKLVAEGKDLYWWHPLVSGDADTVHQAGISVRDRVSGPEESVDPEDLVDHVVTWPWRAPRRRP